MSAQVTCHDGNVVTTTRAASAARLGRAVVPPAARLMGPEPDFRLGPQLFPRFRCDSSGHWQRECSSGEYGAARNRRAARMSHRPQAWASRQDSRIRCAQTSSARAHSRQAPDPITGQACPAPRYPTRPRPSGTTRDASRVPPSSGAARHLGAGHPRAPAESSSTPRAAPPPPTSRMRPRRAPALPPPG